MSDETKTVEAPQVPKTPEAMLLKRHNDQLQQLVQQRTQIVQALQRTEDQIKMLQGAIWSLNELAEVRRTAIAAATAESTNGATETTPSEAPAA